MSRHLRSRLLAGLVAGTLLGFMTGCVSGRYGVPGEILPRLGDEIVVCGQLVHTGTPVVLWMDPGGYDAYRAECHFTPEQTLPSNPVSDSPVRYSSFRKHVSDEVARQIRDEGWNLPLLQEWVDLFVLHYDACGTSRRSFEVLQDRRGLSVHFMLDLDGTIYQTLDLKERAWHAGTANDRSVGVEIANIGAYSDRKTLDEWYARDADGRTYVTLPERLGESGLRTPDFVARPSRNDLIAGTVNGHELYQYDLTDAQYEALTRLTATLCQVLPRIRPDCPRDGDGQVCPNVLPDETLAGFSGILGHWHITEGKVDPGPAFDWERLLTGVADELQR